MCRAWATIVAGLIVLQAAFKLLTIGILGEYLGRVYDEVKRRPRYLGRAPASDTALSILRRRPE